MGMWLETEAAIREAGLMPSQLPPIDRQTRLLVIAPHPDDETIATGQLIQRVRRAGGSVRVLVLTGGDNNPWPQRWLERRLRVGPRERARWAARRRQELSLALAALGLAEQDWRSLGWPDLGMTDALRSDAPTMLATLEAELAGFRPGLVIVPDLADRHPDHGAGHVLVRLALARWGQPHHLLGYLIHGRPRPGTCWVAWPPMAGLQVNKEVAIRCHRTQMALSGRRLLRYVRREERFCVYPASGGSGDLPWRIRRPLASTLRLLLATPNGAEEWRWRDAPIAHGEGGCLGLRLPVARPCFVKLHSKLPGPWIFDHWGWQEL